MKEKFINYVHKHIDTLEGKVILVTGSTGGLGGCIVEYLASLGAELILPVRNTNKGNTLKDSILEKYPNTKIHIEKVDFQDFNSIDEFTKVLENYPKIDVLYNNIGALSIKETDKDIESVLKTNAISTVNFTEKVLPYIQFNGKIISTTSVAIYFYKKIHNFKDYDFFNGSDMKKYSISKKILTHCMLKLQEIYPQYYFILAHPGATATALFSKAKSKFIRLFNAPLKLLFHSKEKAALSLIAPLYLDVNNDKWCGPRGLLKLCGKPKVSKLPKKIQIKDDIDTSYDIVKKYIK